VSNHVPIQSSNISFQLNRKIGGFLGFKMTPFFSTLHFDSNEFFAGELINVRILMDNSRCKKDVKNVKLRLNQYVRLRAEQRTRDSNRELSFLRIPVNCKKGGFLEQNF
jgi:hypothetical protein